MNHPQAKLAARDVRIEHRVSRLLPDQQEKEQEHQRDTACRGIAPMAGALAA
jgi:hypothetical protein